MAVERLRDSNIIRTKLPPMQKFLADMQSICKREQYSNADMFRNTKTVQTHKSVNFLVLCPSINQYKKFKKYIKTQHRLANLYTIYYQIFLNGNTGNISLKTFSCLADERHINNNLLYPVLLRDFDRSFTSIFFGLFVSLPLRTPRFRFNDTCFK